ncbi:hypothetical protein M0R45_010245 [Rubus argutus]|uniref:Uncharacterized protein n=1 Tax=Rubus argutus TaxID=59490 RepID=A0AAW1YAB0_RUBAR
MCLSIARKSVTTSRNMWKLRKEKEVDVLCKNVRDKQIYHFSKYFKDLIREKIKCGDRTIDPDICYEGTDMRLMGTESTVMRLRTHEYRRYLHEAHGYRGYRHEASDS